MDAKEYLHQLDLVHEKIRLLDLKIERKEDLLHSISSIGFEPHNQTSPSTEAAHSRRIIELDQLRSDRKQLSVLQNRLMEEAESLIETLADERASILMDRFLGRRSLRSIAIKHCMSKSTVERRLTSGLDELRVQEHVLDVDSWLISHDLQQYL